MILRLLWRSSLLVSVWRSAVEENSIAILLRDPKASRLGLNRPNAAVESF